MTYDWPKMIRELREQGFTDWKLAQVVGYEHPKEIRAIEQGRIPRHDIGELIIGLHNMMCPNGQVSPTFRVSDSAES